MKLWIKKISLIFAVLFMVNFVSGCEMSSNKRSVTREIFAMDTYMSITGYGRNCQEAVDEAVAEIERLDRLFSIGNANSEISEINEKGHKVLSEDAMYLVDKSIEYSRATNGAFDITVYPLMDLWGFVDKNHKVPEENEIQAELEIVDYQKLSVSEFELTLGEGQKIDLGGIAKGYASSKIMDIFEKYELEAGLVYLGGNVQCYRKKVDGSKWTCAVMDPLHPNESNKYLGVLKVEDRAVITSGAYERYFIDEATGKKYHHILDAKTGYPADNGLISVTIVSEDGTLADAFSTAVYILGKEQAIELWKTSEYDYDMILMTEEGKVYVTDGIESDFSSEYGIEVICR